jgi:hypothetical protein
MDSVLTLPVASCDHDYRVLVAVEMAAKPSTETELYGTRDMKKR